MFKHYNSSTISYKFFYGKEKLVLTAWVRILLQSRNAKIKTMYLSQNVTNVRGSEWLSYRLILLFKYYKATYYYYYYYYYYCNLVFTRWQ